MRRTKKRWILFCGFFLAGCSLPNTKTPEPVGMMSLGLAGQGYSIQSLLAQPEWLFQAVSFKPTKVEIHYAGPVGASVPADIPGQATDQSAANPSLEADLDPTANDGQWIALPLAEAPAFDLMALGSRTVWLGEGLLKAGKYDKIRLTGGGEYQATKDSEPATGSYVLPSGRLYLNQGFEIREGHQTELSFAFDAGTAMVTNASRVILKPTSVKVFAKYAEATASVQ